MSDANALGLASAARAIRDSHPNRRSRDRCPPSWLASWGLTAATTR